MTSEELKEEQIRFSRRAGLYVGIFIREIIFNIYTNQDIGLRGVRFHFDNLIKLKPYEDERLKTLKNIILRIYNFIDILENKPIKTKINFKKKKELPTNKIETLKTIKHIFLENCLTLDGDKDLNEKKYNEFDKQLDKTLCSIVNYFLNYIIDDIMYKKPVLIEYDLLLKMFKENYNQITFEQELQLQSIKILLNLFLIKFEKINYIQFNIEKNKIDRKEYLGYLCNNYIKNLKNR